MVQQWRRGIYWVTVAAITGIGFFLSRPSAAQLLPDNSLDAESTIITPNVNIEGRFGDLIEGGAQRGANLFHSFQEFNIGESQRVYFANPVGIETILSRVTGSNLSNILGALGVLGDANLFLINPQGIFFGPNATLDMRASFTASTASSIRFANNVDFSAINPSPPPLLTIGVPIGLQFNGGEGDIVVQAGQISKPNNPFIEVDDAGQLLNSAQIVNSSTSEVTDAISGDLERDEDVDLYQISLKEGQPFTASTVAATNINTQLFLFDSSGLGVAANNDSVGFQSTVPLYQSFIPPRSGIYYLGISSYSNNPLSSQGYIFDAVENPSGSGAGLPLNRWDENPRIPTVRPASGAYTITLNSRQEGLQVQSGRTLALVSNQVRLEGGRLEALGGQIELTGVGGSGIVGLVQQGQEWRLSVPDGLVRADISLTEDALINVSAGGGGSIAIHGRNVDMTSSSLLAGVAPRLGSVGAKAGNIEINTTEAITLAASSVTNDVAIGAIGDAGDLNLATGAFSTINGAGLYARTYGVGNAGNINIEARDAVSFDYSLAVSIIAPSGRGQGGDIRISGDSISVTNIAQLAALTQGDGDAGNVIINARDTVRFDGSDPKVRIASSAFSSVGDNSLFGSTVIGDGGNVQITANSVFLTNRAQLISATNGQGSAGNVIIYAYDTVSFDGGSAAASGVFPAGIGNGGSINITSESLLLNNNAALTVKSIGLGSAGSLTVAADAIQLDNQARINADTVGGGGNIDLRSPLLTLRRDSSITTNASGTATGGNIDIDADFVISAPNENNDIIANAFEGSGGRINLTAQDIFWFDVRTREDLQRLLGTTDPTQLDPRNLPTNDITAFSQTNSAIDTGSVTVQTPDPDPAGGLTVLPTDFADPSQLIAATCPSDKGSSFAVTGRGGLPEDPRQPLVGQVIWQDDRGEVGNQKIEKRGDREMERSNSTAGAIAEAQGWMVDHTGTIVLLAQDPTGQGSAALRNPNCALLKRSL
ncbi:filamentous hemagglutinin N-terminal domain-containing protein [Trichocoleus sp. FACHB-591]|uniref:two-partner secretion domain-containing protein n=1 Tax=Trichocoleus sp. FACHB-591 TaxID=2692872 RepID=UPI0016860FED|nr:filamentous hemagglutinin N-terminal domain-containing protein [Trichocoleus sp. FACHB-591]MBD2096012.1 filamentous hemagglutinin N-terminal domain-containing protein [Trichocoleus sp. FACHB-591]